MIAWQLAIMCICDLVAVAGDEVLPLLDVGGAIAPGTSVLNQLLLKATSNDKRFVVDEATHALETISERVSSQLLAPIPHVMRCPMQNASAGSLVHWHVTVHGLLAITDITEIQA